MAYFSSTALLSGPHAGHDVRRSWHDDFLYQIQFENSIVLRTRTPGCTFISVATPHYFQWIRMCILQTKTLFRHDLQRTKMTIKISEFHVFQRTGMSARNRLDSLHVNARRCAAPPDAFIGAIVFFCSRIALSLYRICHFKFSILLSKNSSKILAVV